MKRILLVALVGISVMLTSCQAATPYEPAFRTIDNVLQYQNAQGIWVVLYDFTTILTHIPSVEEVTVVSAELNDAQELIFIYSDGESHNLGCISQTIQQDILFAGAQINDQGELILTATSGDSMNLGQVVGAKGDRGNSGSHGATGATGAAGAVGATGPQGTIGAVGLTISTSKDEAELFALTAVTEVDIIVLVGNVVVSGLSNQVVDGELVLNFGAKTLSGDLTIETPFEGVVKLIHGTIQGNLIVSGIHATFDNHLNVTGQITIRAVSENSWNQFGDVNNIVITADGGTFNFLAGMIAECIRIVGDSKSKIFVFAGSSLQAPVFVETSLQLIFDQSITTAVTLNYLNDEVRANCSIFNNTSKSMVIDGSDDVEATSNTVFIKGQPETYQSIQSGLDAASAGDTIYVGHGEYTEHLVIRSAVVVFAFEGVVLINPTPGTETIGISVVANIEGTTTIEGFELRGYRNGIVASSQAIVKNNTIYAENYGLATAYLRNGIQIGSTVASADGSIVENNTVHGAPLTDAWSGTAINIVNSSNVIVRNNTILGDNDIGIGILDFSGVNVSGVQILHNIVNGAKNAIRIDGWYTLTPYAQIENILIEGNTLVGKVEDPEKYLGINMQWVKVIHSVFKDNTYTGYSLNIRVSPTSGSTDNVTSDGVDVSLPPE